MKWLLICSCLMPFAWAGNKYAGPFNVKIKEPFICEDEGTKDVYLNETVIRKRSKSGFDLSTRVNIRVPYDDVLQLTVNFAVWGNGGWRPNFLTLNYGGACSASRTLIPGIYKGLLQHFNLTSCPIPEGEYYLKDVDGSPQVAIPSLPYQKYKVYMIFTKEAVTVGCVGLVVNIVPKEKNNSG